ncbi:MAG: YceD family protein [Gammaproteobacteria bacterium]
MSGALPEYLDLTRTGFEPVMLSGRMELAALPRLAEAVAAPGGEAAVELRAFHDGGHTLIRGRVQAMLILACQRCFGNMEFPVAADFKLAWVRCEKDVASLPEAYEPLVSASGRVKPAEIVEDELLLALPMAALHESSRECGESMRRGLPRHKSEGIHAVRVKPFAALKALKRR